MKKIIYVLLFIFLINFNVVEVSAGEIIENDAIQKDDKGCYIYGVLAYQLSDNGTWWKYCLTGTNLYVVKYSETTYSIFASNQYVEYDLYFNYEYSESRSFNFGSYGGSYRFTGITSGTFITNLPIFNANDEEAINNYLNNGDISGADNYDEINPADEESSDIPLPHNLRVVSGTSQHVTTTLGDDVIDMYPLTFSRDIVITWEQSDVLDNLEYEAEACITTLHLDGDGESGSGLEKYLSNTTAYYPVGSSSYNGNKTITFTISKDTMNNHKVNGLLKSAKIRIRNRTSGKTSKWVVVTIDFVNKSANAFEDGYADGDEDIDEDGGEYNDTSVSDDGQLVDKVIEGSSDVSLNGVMSFIRDGFGLLGNGGIIALLSSTFVYLPNSIWVMLKFLVAMMIAVCIIKLVKDVVT